MDEKTFEQTETDTPWKPPAGLTKALDFFRSTATLTLAGLAVFLVCRDAFATRIILFNISMAALLALAFAIRETGRIALARWRGMTAVYVRLGPLDIVPLRRGFRCRFKRHPFRQPVAFTVAYPDLKRPLREQMLWFAIGGGIANALVVLALALVVVVLPEHSDRAFAGAALAVATIPLLDIIPSTEVMETNGTLAWRWWRHAPEHPDIARWRANALLHEGCPVSQLPAQDQATLMESTGPMAVTGIWYLVKAHQQTGAWSEALAHEDLLDALMAAANTAWFWAESIDLIRGELAFSHAVVERDASHLPEAAVLHRTAWGNPCLSARCDAWRAHLLGQTESRDRAVAAGLAIAARVADRSLEASERLIADQLYARA